MYYIRDTFNGIVGEESLARETRGKPLAVIFIGCHFTTAAFPPYKCCLSK